MDGAAEDGRHGLSRGVGGKNPRARAARLGDDAEQSRHRAPDARGARERDGAAGGGCGGLSRGAGEITRERVPLDWAATQTNLGTALEKLGGPRAGPCVWRRLWWPIARRLEERTRERVPLDWAASQNNLGNALLEARGVREQPVRLEEAVVPIARR